MNWNMQLSKKLSTIVKVRMLEQFMWDIYLCWLLGFYINRLHYPMLWKIMKDHRWRYNAMIRVQVKALLYIYTSTTLPYVIKDHVFNILDNVLLGRYNYKSEKDWAIHVIYIYLCWVCWIMKLSSGSITVCNENAYEVMWWQSYMLVRWECTACIALGLCIRYWSSYEIF